MLYNRQRIIAIEGVPSCGSLLIAMFQDEEGDNYVELSAWHEVPGESPKFQITKMYFDNDSLSEKFIKGYPSELAEVFVQDFYLKEVAGASSVLSKPRITSPSNLTRPL